MAIFLTQKVKKEVVGTRMEVDILSIQKDFI